MFTQPPRRGLTRAAEDFARGDPFVLNGMVSQWQIREWTDLFASPT